MVLSEYRAGTRGDRWESGATGKCSIGDWRITKSPSSLRELGEAGGTQWLGTVTKHLKRPHKHHEPYKLREGNPGPPTLPQWNNTMSQLLLF